MYAVHDGHGEIRRVNINAAPLDHAGFRTVKAAGIGTYQIFQETYHHATYAARAPAGHAARRDYLWRLDALDRAWKAAATTSASARCSVCTTGASRCSAWSRTRGT